MIYSITIQPIEWLLREFFLLCYTWVGSYPLALLLLSLATSTAMLPLQKWSGRLVAREQRIQRVLAPQRQQIRHENSGEERYRREVDLHRRYGYHPVYALRSAAGVMIQLPVLMAAYFMLSSLDQLHDVSFFGLFDLGRADGMLAGIHLMPLLMTVVNVMVLLTTRGTTSKDRLQGYGIALLFLILLYDAVSALLLYWTLNNLFGLARNLVILPYQNRRGGGFLPPEALASRQIGGREGRKKWTHRCVGCSNNVLAMLTGWLIILLILGSRWNNFSYSIVIFWGFPFVLAVIAVVLTGKRFLLNTDWHHAPSRRVAYILALLLAGFGYTFWEILFGSADIFLAAIGLISSVIFALLALERTGAALLPKYQTGIPASVRDRALGIFVVLLPVYFFLDLPLMLFMNDPESFYISFYSLFLPLSLLALSCALVALVLIRFCTVNIKELLLPGIVAVTLIALFHGHVSLRDYGLMDHFTFNQPSLLKETVLSSLLELSLLYLLVWMAYRYAQRFGRFIVPMGIGLLVLSVVASANNAYQGIALSEEAVDPSEESPFTDGIALSDTKTNVFVFLLDGFSGSILPELLANLALEDSFKDFTWYRNTLATNGGTWAALPALLGGHRFTVESINTRSDTDIRQMLDAAYNTLPSAFLPKGYDVVFFNPYWGGHLKPDPSLKVIGVKPKKSGQYDIDTIAIWVRRMVYLSGFKVAPLAFKEAAYRFFPSSDELGVLKKLAHWKLLSNIIDNPVRKKQKPTLMFAHLLMPHLPASMDAQCRPTITAIVPDYLNEARCTLLAMGRFLRHLKNEGGYDNSLIAIVSDHGWWVKSSRFSSNFNNVFDSFPENRVIPGMAHALLMIKEPGEQQSRMKTSDTFMSNADLPSILCSVIGGCDGVGPDARNLKGNRELIYNVFRPRQKSWLDGTNGYERSYHYRQLSVRNNIFDVRNWKEIPLR